MSFVKASEHLKKYNLENKIIVLETSSATVKEASMALNCKESEIAKSLSFIIGYKPILIVTSGDKKIDNAKFKMEFNTKARMIPFEMVEELIGHNVGGVCPFGINDNVSVYLDLSLKKFDTIYSACGSPNSVAKLKLEELEMSSNYIKWIDVCK